MPSGGKFKSRGSSRSVAGGKTRKLYGKKRGRKTRHRRMRHRKIIKGGIVVLS